MNSKERRRMRRAIDAAGERPSELVKLTRSVTRKVNLGNYESADVFCSLSVECYQGEAEEKSLLAYEWVKRQVHRDIATINMVPSPKTESKQPSARANAEAFRRYQADKERQPPARRMLPEDAPAHK